MDYNNRQYLQQQSQTVPHGIDPYAHLYNAHQPYNTYTFSHYPPNINPRSHATDNGSIQYEHIGATCSIYSQPQTTAYEPQTGLVTSCYRDPIVTNRRTDEEFGGYNANPVIYRTAGIQTIARPVQPEPTLNPIPNHWQYKLRKNASKKTKIVQSAWCEICKIECTSKEVLDQHKLGKKHQKNLDKLIGSNKNTSTPSTEIKPLSTNHVNLTKGKRKKTTANSRKRVSSEDENLETKKQKLMDGGASPGSVRVCAICNVVVNSELVFSYHLAGQKHAAQVKKHATQDTDGTELPSSDKAACE